MAGAVLAAAIAVAVAAARPVPDVRPDARPNAIVVPTDDQRWDTLEAMPWLRGELARDGSGWATLPLAFANTPLCCPSRASLLTGAYAHHTAVVDNGSGIAWMSRRRRDRLRESGYRTGLVGKYLNRYPFGRLPYVPPGWDRVRRQAQPDRRHGVPGLPRDRPGFAGVRPSARDRVTGRARRRVRTLGAVVPAVLPPVRAERSPSSVDPRDPRRRCVRRPPRGGAPNVVGALRGAPPWVLERPLPSAAQRTAWLRGSATADETLLRRRRLRAIVDALAAIDRTAIIVLSDNGYSFGEHR